MLTHTLKRSVVRLLGRDRVNRLTGPAHDWQAARRSRRFLQQLKQDHLLINLGSGPDAMDGWVNVDIDRGPQVDVVMDIRHGLPFQDNSCQAVFSEHMIEHISRDDGVKLLRECYRVLEPGGVVRMSTPDAGRYLRSYAGDGKFLRQMMEFRPAPTPLDRVNLVMREGGHHLWLYDTESLGFVFREGGFTVTLEQSAKVSMCKAMGGIDSPNRICESLYLEGLKQTDANTGNPAAG